MDTDQIQSQPPAQPEAPSLQLSDLVLMLKLIQATAQRGAIRAEEMAEVGALHDKLFKFLNSTGAIQPAEDAPKENQNG
mgnify:CR=1 FL=1